MKNFVIGSFFILFLFSCKDNQTEISQYGKVSSYEKGEELSAGKFSFVNSDKSAFSEHLKGMDESEKIDFLLGERLFKTNWVPAPASTSGLDGLGPTFVSKSCQICHIRNGRGQPFNKFAKESFGFLMRISVSGKGMHGGAKPVWGYGTQLQNRGILKVKGEADINVNYEYIKGKYPDGTPYELRKPTYTLTNGRYGELPNDLLLSPRVGTQVIGLGFVDGLSEHSGKPNYVWNVEEQKNTIGKFGWKANAPTLKQQNAGAFHQDIGITTPMFPHQNCPDPQSECQNLPNGNDREAEVSSQGLKDITFFLGTVEVPMRRNYKNKDVLEGKVLFNKLNCIACHKIGLKVTNSKIYPKINGTIINPYSDFLLHDMGENLADNRPDFLANGREWRTQPLWGIGLIKKVNNHTYLLHDGRARNIEEAILWHGGEAEKSKQEFINLSAKQRKQVLNFINSL